MISDAQASTRNLIPPSASSPQPRRVLRVLTTAHTDSCLTPLENAVDTRLEADPRSFSSAAVAKVSQLCRMKVRRVTPFLCPVSFTGGWLPRMAAAFEGLLFGQFCVLSSVGPLRCSSGAARIGECRCPTPITQNKRRSWAGR